MITQEEWDNLKDHERYGMIASIFTKLEKLETRINYLEQKHGKGE